MCISNNIVSSWRVLHQLTLSDFCYFNNIAILDSKITPKLLPRINNGVEWPSTVDIWTHERKFPVTTRKLGNKTWIVSPYGLEHTACQSKASGSSYHITSAPLPFLIEAQKFRWRNSNHGGYIQYLLDIVYNYIADIMFVCIWYTLLLPVLKHQLFTSCQLWRFFYHQTYSSF